MALVVMSFQVDDYDEWKKLFDADPADRKSVAKGHRLSRSVDNPNEVYLAVEFPSADDARTVVGRLRERGVFERYTPTVGPTITEVAEEITY